MVERENNAGESAQIAALLLENAELKRSLAQAEQHIARLTRMLETVPGICWTLEGSPGTPDYRTTYINEEEGKLLGYQRDEWIGPGTMWMNIVHPDDKEWVAAHIASSPAGHIDPHRVVTKAGKVVWIEPYYQIFRGADGERLGMCGVSLDVTDRIEAQRAHTEGFSRTQELSRRLDDLIASVPGLVWEERGAIGDPDHMVTFASDYVETLLGYSAEECRKDPHIWQRIAHPEDQEYAARTVRALYEVGLGTLQYRWITKEGRTIWVETHLRAIRDESGAAVGARGVTMDITARKLAEEEHERMKDELIRAQAAALLELSTPLIPISKDVMVMPLIGTIDNARAMRVIEALLAGLYKARARFAILDVTGVPSVNAETADALLRAARAVKLLGAQVILTGIRPEVAETLIALGASFEGIVTSGNLESGIAYATARR